MTEFSGEVFSDALELSVHTCPSQHEVAGGQGISLVKPRDVSVMKDDEELNYDESFYIYIKADVFTACLENNSSYV